MGIAHLWQKVKLLEFEIAEKSSQLANHLKRGKQCPLYQSTIFSLPA
ncbi:hypothetical protein CKA32_004205 [Geitlerinema sp. FC II]|nr:hypothetical protein CKA32_004205 [Geitlerinema sp. FC II]